MNPQWVFRTLQSEVLEFSSQLQLQTVWGKAWVHALQSHDFGAL